MANQVETLRRFRDTYLLSHIVGRKLVGLYYRIGKPAATYIEANPWLKPPFRVFLLPVVGIAWLMFSAGVLIRGLILFLILLCSAMAVRRLGAGKRLL